MTNPQLPVVVVGAGVAGVRTCEQLRKQGWQGPIVLINGEGLDPYDRPPLTKAPFKAPTPLPIEPADLDVDVRSGWWAARLTGVSENGGQPLTLQLAHGSAETEDLTADVVVIATGATPILPDDWRTSGVHTLRTAADAADLWRAFDELPGDERPGERSVTIVGGSWLGLELASTFASAGARVTVIEQGDSLVPSLPPQVGDEIATWCQTAGIEVRLGTRATPAADDLVVAAIGVRPDTDWLRGSGLDIDPDSYALRVNEAGATSDPRVFALGDAVQRWAPHHDRWLATGHWQVAWDQPEVVAAHVIARLTGAQTTAAYEGIGYFWSEMFGHMLQFVGDAEVAGAPTLRRDFDDPAEWTMIWTDDANRLVALLTCDHPRDLVAARKALQRNGLGQVCVDVGRAADPVTPLAGCLTAVEPAAP